MSTSIAFWIRIMPTAVELTYNVWQCSVHMIPRKR